MNKQEIYDFLKIKIIQYEQNLYEICFFPDIIFNEKNNNFKVS